MVAQRAGQLFAAEIEGAHRHRLAFHAADQRREHGILLVLPRQIVAVHVEKLGAHQPQPHRPVGRRLGQLDRQFEIGFEGDLDPVAGRRRQPAQPRQMTPLARQQVAPRLVIGDGLRRRVDDHGPLGAVDHHHRVGPRMLDQLRDGEHRRQPQRARDDRGMAFGAAELGGETGDALRVHQRGVGRGQLVGEDHRARGDAGKRHIGFFDQVADQPGADHADILDPRRQIGVAHRRKALGDLVDLDLDGALGIDPRPVDALADAAHQARIGQHRHMGVEQIADLLGGGFGQAGGFGLELAQLLQRHRHRLGEAVALGLDPGIGDVAFMDRKIAALADIGRSDGDPRRHSEPGQSLFGGGGLCGQPGRRVNPH